MFEIYDFVNPVLSASELFWRQSLISRLMNTLIYSVVYMRPSWTSCGSGDPDRHFCRNQDYRSAATIVHGPNFYGTDVLSLSAENKNGWSDAQVTARVNLVNDPPFIRILKSVILDREPVEGVPIFGDVSGSPSDLFIGDPDLPNFPENKSCFLVTLSLELSDGILIANLPAYLKGKVELKIKNSHQWQHLQTIVTISNHFMIKAKGLKFRASVEDCNNAIQKLRNNNRWILGCIAPHAVSTEIISLPRPIEPTAN